MALILSASAVLMAGCGQNARAENEEEKEMNKTISRPYTADSSIEDVINEPVFGDYGRLLLPADEYYWSGDKLSDLRLTWYNTNFQWKVDE